MSLRHHLGAATAAVLLAGLSPAQNFTARIYVDVHVAAPGDGHSWGTAFRFLQDGLDAARTELLQNSGPVEVWVADGFYLPTYDVGHPNGSLDRQRSFELHDDISLFGGFVGDETSRDQRQLFDGAHKSVLMGSIGPNTNSYHVVDGSFAGGNAGLGWHLARLDGFEIREGDASGPGNYAFGGGYYSEFGRQVIANCRFIDNSADALGGNLYVRNAGTRVETFNCTVERGNAIAGGGAACVDGGVLTFQPGVLRANGLDHGGNRGGALYADGANTAINLFHATLSGNEDNNGGDFTVDGGATIFFGNCVLWGGSSTTGTSDVGLLQAGTVTFDHCVVEGGTSQIQDQGTGTLNVWSPLLTGDPLFRDAPPSYLEIDLLSSCAGQASTLWKVWDWGDIDQDGDLSEVAPLDMALHAREVGAAWDIGAFEARGVASSYCTAHPNSVSAGGARLSVSCYQAPSANNLTLSAGPVPNQPGLFFVGPTALASEVPFGDGARCVGGTLVRLGIVQASGNALTLQPSLSFPVLSGATWNFQCWYRDNAAGGAGFNLSDAVSLTF